MPSTMASHVNGLLKCPELLLRGADLQQRGVELHRLEKKGKRFESAWHIYTVAIYAGVLFYYDDVDAFPHGVVPLAGSSVKSVDRIFKSHQATATTEMSAEECGPCFKVTSTAQRVLLFRCVSEAERDNWIQWIKRASIHSLSGTCTCEDEMVPSTNFREEESLKPVVDVRAPDFTRHSLDEVRIRRRSQNYGTLEDQVAVQPEISQMLRDAMALIRTQKQEILELREALQAAQQGEYEDLHTHDDFTDRFPDNSVDIDVMDQSHDKQAVQRKVGNPAHTLPPVEVSSTDYLQKQAMELAEIARNLQLTFQNDVLISKQISSTSSSAATEMLDRVSLTASNYSTSGVSDGGGGRSEIDNEDDADSDRLSDFDESDARFLESNGLLDSIQRVMQDFISPTSAPQPRHPVVIDDSVFANIRGQQPPHKLRLYSLDDSARAARSQSSCDESTDFKVELSPYSVARTQSAHDILEFELDRPRGTRRVVAKDLGTLVVEDNMAVVGSILQTASREEKTLLLLPLLRTFGSHNRLSRLIRWAIECEVASVMNIATLFRSDDYASRLVSTYSKTVGSRYIKEILTDPIQVVYMLKPDDVDLKTDLPGAPSLRTRQNARNIMDACQMVLDSILANKSSIPSSYFHICSDLNAKVISRFDGSMEGLAVEDPVAVTRSVIGGFLFLRFVCPAITTPHLHGLTDTEPTPDMRRILVLITKLLFKTATNVLFGDKEPHLRILNPFIEKNAAAMEQLFADMSVAPQVDIDECFASDSLNLFSHASSDQRQTDLDLIRSIAAKNFSEIEKKLSVCGCSPLTTETLRASVFEAPVASSLNKSKTKKLNMRFLSGFGKMVRKQSEA
ncbi:hypothetical protein PINS_up000162 [Pythium insidiosum]|nr:hypothetical protein PINS_up000162 [Pythium insidiosum]